MSEDRRTLRLEADQVSVIKIALKKYIQFNNMVELNKKNFEVAKQTLNAFELTIKSELPDDSKRANDSCNQGDCE